MTLKIEVLIPQDDVRAGAAGAYLEAALTGIGYVRLTAGEGNGLPAAESLPRAEVETDLPEQAKPAPAKPTKSKAKTEKAKAPEAAVPAISTGEERIDPETPETPEVAAQDAADEAAEAEATAKPELTHDDVRAELKKYLDKFGTPAAMEDGPKVFALMFGAGVSKVSEIPADQDSLRKAVEGVAEMLLKNPYKRAEQAQG